MAGSSDAFRGVRFQTATAETPGKKEKRGWRGRLRSLFGGKRREEPALEPIVFVAPGQEGAAVRAERSAPGKADAAASMVFLEPENEIKTFIKSLPNDQARAYAAAAVRRLYGDAAPTLEEAKEALALDTGNGGQDMQNRREMLFALAFSGKKAHLMGTGALENGETVNVFYYKIDLFTNMVTMLRRDGEEEGLRSKCMDRLSMLQAMERMLLAMPLSGRIDAFGLIVGIAMKMGETLCTKEVCKRMESVLGIMAGEEGDKLGMLAKMHGNVVSVGVRPSGMDMRSGVPRVEKDRVERWIKTRPEGGVREAAAAAWERKPGSHLEFMMLLEEEPVDTENRRLHVLEEVVGGNAVGTWVSYRASDVPEMVPVAWNIGYYCITPIRFVADFAEGMDKEEGVRLAVLDTMLWLARRMPPGRRMEAPGLIASAAEKLAMPDEQMGLGACPKEWILGHWLGALKAYMSEPNAEIAYKRLLLVPMDPMRVVGYVGPK